MSIWSEKITNCARNDFNIAHLLPVQQLVIHNILEALFPEEDRDYYKNQLIILPTGTGKSVCFQIPASIIKSPTIIIYPLISLINDQLRRMNEAGVRSYRIVGGMDNAELMEIMSALDDGTCQCILTNPESLECKKYIELLLKYRPELIVIDESHCISKWGNSFRHSYLNVGKQVKYLDAKVVVAFTATASESVIQDIKKILFLNDDMYILRGHANRENITYSVLYCTDREQSLVDLCQPLFSEKNTVAYKREHMLGMYEVHDGKQKIERPAIVFCTTRTLCIRLTLKLRYELGDSNIFFYHAGLKKTEKNKIEEWFLHSTDGILIATCAYGMGVDKANIRTVVHYEPFSDIENFLQETGRAGRDGGEAKSIMLADIDRERIAHDKTLECRRAYYMSTLGLESESCTGCDICVGMFPLYPNVYTYIIECIKEYPRCFDKMELVEYVATSMRIIDLTERAYIMHSVEMLLSKGIITQGKYLWKGKLSLNQDVLTAIVHEN